MRELGVEKSAFDEGEAGAVSHEVAVQMARGARYQSGSDVSIAITGIAGPGGGTPERPVGTVCIAWKINGKPEIKKTFLFQGSRNEVRYLTVVKALEEAIRLFK